MGLDKKKKSVSKYNGSVKLQEGVFSNGNNVLRSIRDYDSTDKYFAVCCKCGHVDRIDNYVPIIFPVAAKNAKSAAQIAREYPRVKHDKKDAIIFTTEISKDQFFKLYVINEKDPYLKATSAEISEDKNFNKRILQDSSDPDYKHTTKEERKDSNNIKHKVQKRFAKIFMNETKNNELVLQKFILENRKYNKNEIKQLIDDFIQEKYRFRKDFAIVYDSVQKIEGSNAGSANYRRRNKEKFDEIFKAKFDVAVKEVREATNEFNRNKLINKTKSNVMKTKSSINKQDAPVLKGKTKGLNEKSKTDNKGNLTKNNKENNANNTIKAGKIKSDGVNKSGINKNSNTNLGNNKKGKNPNPRKVPKTRGVFNFMSNEEYEEFIKQINELDNNQ